MNKHTVTDAQWAHPTVTHAQNTQFSGLVSRNLKLFYLVYTTKLTTKTHHGLNSLYKISKKDHTHLISFFRHVPQNPVDYKHHVYICQMKIF